MQTGNRFCAYPAPAQEQILLQWIGYPGFVSDARVSEDRYNRAFAKKAVSFSSQSRSPVSTPPERRVRGKGRNAFAAYLAKGEHPFVRPETPPAAQSA